MKRRLKRRGRCTVFAVLLALLTFITITDSYLQFPEKIILYEGEHLSVRSASAYSIDVPAAVGGVFSDVGTLEADPYNHTLALSETGHYDMTVKLFGLIPVRSVDVTVQPQTSLYACGNTVGIKIFTKGLVCVGTQEIESTSGQRQDISRLADIRTGDIFISADGHALISTEQMGNLVANSNGNSICFTLLRDGRELIKELTPLATADGYKLGIWLRDSTAGIGTLTYYQPETYAFGALGHPITDTDTNALMPVSEGTLLRSSIVSIKKGEKGEPGELKGIFKTNESNLGFITKNTEQGIFGTLQEEPEATRLYAVASSNQVREGAATILSNITGNAVEEFSVEIQKNLPFYAGDCKDLIIRVTDPQLLEKTGGIVQGMSGSPIIQDGKLVGAVTHVFVNDPTRGYGIFIENMLERAS